MHREIYIYIYMYLITLAQVLSWPIIYILKMSGLRCLRPFSNMSTSMYGYQYVEWYLIIISYYLNYVYTHKLANTNIVVEYSTISLVKKHKTCIKYKYVLCTSSHFWYTQPLNFLFCDYVVSKSSVDITLILFIVPLF